MKVDSKELTLSNSLKNSIEVFTEKARGYLKHSLAANTLRGYASDWRDFTVWCQACGRVSLPALPETVSLYLSALAERAKTSTLTRRLSAISQAHQAAGFETPTHSPLVRQVMKGIRRVKGTAQAGKSPLKVEHLRAIVLNLNPKRPLDARDRALVLVGFAGALRRSELVSLNIEDLEFNDDGLVIHLRHSKTDQAGEGRDVGIPYGSTPATCPVRAVKEWLAVLKADEGPVFRTIHRDGKIFERRLSSKAVALVIRRLTAKHGIAGDFAGHSLRAGLVTAAAAAGVPERAIMAQTGHKSLATMRKYIREGSLFLENAAGRVGL